MEKNVDIPEGLQKAWIFFQSLVARIVLMIKKYIIYFVSPRCGSCTRKETYI